MEWAPALKCRPKDMVAAPSSIRGWQMGHCLGVGRQAGPTPVPHLEELFWSPDIRTWVPSIPRTLIS